MSKLDEFESLFKSAAKPVFKFLQSDLKSVCVVTDLGEEATKGFAGDLKHYLAAVTERDEMEWHVHAMGRDENVGDLLAYVEKVRPDLICTYRNLCGAGRGFPFSLGSHVDVLTQATTTPVLLLPLPEDNELSLKVQGTHNVMVLTDHLAGSESLVNQGVHYTARGGKLVLAHVEDDAVFARYIEVIGKIPDLDTDVAREKLGLKLLAEPADYIERVREVLATEVPDLRVVSEVIMGHQVRDCQALIDKHQVDLVVMNTKDEEQLAMHGLAYPLAIQLRTVPLLLL